jgi:hypothetical protein
MGVVLSESIVARVEVKDFLHRKKTVAHDFLGNTTKERFYPTVSTSDISAKN